MSITAEYIVKLFEEDVRARKRLAELLVLEPDVRLAIINAVLRDVATKSDIEKLEKTTRDLIESLRKEVYTNLDEMRRDIAELRERIAKLEGVVSQLTERIGDLDKRIDALDKRIDGLDKRIDALDKRIDALDRRIDALDKRIDALDKRIDYATRVTWLLTASVIATLIANIVVALIR